MDFTHKQQIEFIENLNSRTKSIMERNMLQSILSSIYDSKSHITEANGMIHVTMNLKRYRSYMEKILTPQQS